MATGSPPLCSSSRSSTSSAASTPTRDPPPYEEDGEDLEMSVSSSAATKPPRSLLRGSLVLFNSQEDPLQSSSSTNSLPEEPATSSPYSPPSTCRICLEDFANLEAGGERVDLAISTPDAGGYYGSLGVREDRHCSNSNSSGMLQIVPCGHWFCRDCLREHCHHLVTARRVPIPCPDRECDATLDIATVQSVLPDVTAAAATSATSNPTAWIQFLRLHQLHHAQADPNRSQPVLECPFCGALVEPNNHDNDQHCSTCQQTFCRLHGPSHLGVSCVDFSSSPAAQQYNATQRALEQYTKPCSHCRAALQKSAGCDHVVCGACHQDMCWRCGTHVHLTGKLVRHCSQCNRDYRDHRYDRVYRGRLGCLLPLLLPFVILYVVLALAVAILTGCCCGCFRGGRCLVLRNSPTTENNNDKNDENNSGRSNNNSSSSSNRLAPEVTMNDVNGEQPVTRGSARIGILATIFIVFFPVILLSEDFGLHWGMLNEIFPETENEMPVMEVNSAITNRPSSIDRKDIEADKEKAGNSDSSDFVDSSNNNAISRMEEGL